MLPLLHYQFGGHKQISQMKDGEVRLIYTKRLFTGSVIALVGF